MTCVNKFGVMTKQRMHHILVQLCLKMEWVCQFTQVFLRSICKDSYKSLLLNTSALRNHAHT